jgi:hypothetical protein
MTISKDLFLAILSMDSYNRGYNQGITGLGGVGSSIGNAVISSQSDTASGSTGVNAGFYAIAYDTSLVSGNYGDSALNHSSSGVLIRRFRPALARLEGAFGQPLDAGEKAIVAKRPADTLGGAQRCEQVRLRRTREQIGKIGETILDRRQLGEPVVLAAQMRARARPPPILCPLDQPRPHRVERHIPQRRREMLLVHGDRAEAALPEMTAAFASRLDDAGVAAVHPRQRAAQSVGIGWDQNEMHVVRHQAPGPHLDLRLAAMGGEQIAIQRIVAVAEEGACATIAALRDVMRMTGNDDTSEASHAA